ARTVEDPLPLSLVHSSDRGCRCAWLAGRCQDGRGRLDERTIRDAGAIHVFLQARGALLVTQNVTPLTPRADELAAGDIVLEPWEWLVLEADLELAAATGVGKQLDLEHLGPGLALLSVCVEATDLELGAVHGPQSYMSLDERREPTS